MDTGMEKWKLVAIVVASPLTAQAALHVGVGQTYADISAAAAAASPGDFVLIDAGTYPTFTLDKGITLRPNPMTATVIVGAVGQTTPCTIEVPIGQRAHIERLDIRQPVTVTPPPGMSAAGPVSFTEVTSLGGVDVWNASLALDKCNITGVFAAGANVGSGVRLDGASTLSASQCTITGRTLIFAFPAPSGIAASGNSSVIVSDCTVTGGSAGSIHSVSAFGSGMRLTAASIAWCVDSSIAPAVGSSLVPGIDNASPHPVTLERTTTSSTGLVQNGLVLGLGLSAPLMRGNSTQLDFGTRPGLPVIVHGSLDLGRPVLHPYIKQPDWGFISNSILIGALVANGQGVANLPITLPNSPWLQDLPLWFCGWTGVSVPVQLSPVVGGLVR